MADCVACGHRFSASLAFCPKCNAQVPGGKPGQAEANRQINMEIVRDAYRHDARARKAYRAWQVVLLALAFPVAAPTILYLHLVVKRWGTVYPLFFMVTGFVLALFSARWPALCVVMLVSTMACAALMVVRWSRVRYGICFGYNFIVCELYMLGGLLVLTGAAILIPWKPLSRLSAMEDPVPIGPTKVDGLTLEAPNHVAWASERPDWDQRVWHGRQGTEWKYYEADPRKDGAAFDELWVMAPVRGREKSLWVRAGADRAIDPAVPVDGIYVGPAANPAYGLGRVSPREAAEVPFEVQSIWLVTPEEYLESRGEGPRLTRSDAWKGAAIALLGMALIAGAIRLALAVDQ